MKRNRVFSLGVGAHLFFAVNILPAHAADEVPAPAPTSSIQQTQGQSLSSGGALKSQPEIRVPGSQVLSTSKPIAKDSATGLLAERIVKLEKEINNMPSAKGATAKKMDANVRTMVSEILDLNSLAKGALATYWNDFGKKKSPTLKDRARYMKLFKELVEENYLEKARIYVGGKYQIVLTEENKGQAGISVLGHIKKTDVDMDLEFQMAKNDEAWRVRDIQLDSTSLESTYRGSFNSIIKKKGGFKAGFPEIMRAMEKRLKELKKGRATSI